MGGLHGAPGGTVTVGFTGSFTSGKTSTPAFALNGRACGWAAAS